MAKHKAPTQITIASIQEKTLFHEFVERYWKAGVVLAVGATIAILMSTYMRRQAQQVHHSSWDDLEAVADLGGGFFGQVQGGSPESLALFAEQNKETPVGAWGKALEVGSALQADELEEGNQAAEQLTSLWPDHLLSTAKLYPGPDAPRTLAENVRSGKADLEAWEQEHAFLFSNPDLPTDAPRVRLNTSQGALVLGLYSDRAPLHVENFLKLAREGYYNGTKFHRVIRGSLIQAGDPNSIAGAPESWGLGGSEATLEPELDPRLRHFKGALAAWKATGEARSHGSQFFLTTADQNQMDGQSTVFGRVLEGDAVLEAIESGAVVGDRPQDPAVIESVEVL